MIMRGKKKLGRTEKKLKCEVLVMERRNAKWKREGEIGNRMRR